ncbi:MAG: divergent polysaccharide deacetylase family protein [Dongiaceae bacterium]
MARPRGKRRKRTDWRRLLPPSGWASHVVVLVVGIGIGLLLALPLARTMRPSPAPHRTVSLALPVAPPPSRPAPPAAAAPPVRAAAPADAQPASPAASPAVAAAAGAAPPAASVTPSPPPASATPAPSGATQQAALPPGGGTVPAGPAAWQRFAVPAPAAVGRPMIAIIIDDLGLDRPDADRIVALPGPLSLSFMTYAEDLPRQTAAARRRGHELMVHVPMEPLDEELDPGPHTLRVGLGADELLRRLRWGLARFDGYVGINNHMGSRFTESRDGMRVVIEELKSRGLLFVDSRTIGDSVGGKVAAELGVPHVDRDIFLDNEQNAAGIEQQLARTEEVARRRGWAVAIGHPYPATVAALARWLPGLAQRGFVLVPVSAIVRRTAAAG